MKAADQPINIDVEKLMYLCDPKDHTRTINHDIFRRVVAYFATGVRADVRQTRDATGVTVTHVGLIVNRLVDAGYLRVWRGYGGQYRSRRNTFMLATIPEFEPLYQPEDGPRPENLSEILFPRWGDNIAPLIEVFSGYTRRLR